MNIPESNLRNMLKSISELNHVLNERISLSKVADKDCPDCQYDPIRKESMDAYCDTCSGAGKLKVPEITPISASVETMDDFRFDYTALGRLKEGEILVTIDKLEIDDFLNKDGKYNMNDYKDIEKLIHEYDYIEWMGTRYTPATFQPAYLQGNFYELSLTLRVKNG